MSHTSETLAASVELWGPRPMQSEDYKRHKLWLLAGIPEPARV